MPRLILLRHAKAERAERGGAGDHERVLSKRGAADAAEAAKLIAERYGRVDAVLCSTSTRTRQTWEEVRGVLEDPPEPVYLRDIYDAGSDYLEVLQSHGGTTGLLLLIGHNPTIQATALLLAPSRNEAGASMAGRFLTSAFAVLGFDGDWAALQPGAARLADFVTPRGAETD